MNAIKYKSGFNNGYLLIEFTTMYGDTIQYLKWIDITFCKIHLMFDEFYHNQFGLLVIHGTKFCEDFLTMFIGKMYGIC